MKRLLLSFVAVVMAAFVMGQYNVTFNVDVSGVAGFDPATTDVYMSGDLVGGWDEPGTNPDYMMTDDDSDLIYTLVIEKADAEHVGPYKYFFVYDDTPSWDNGEWNGDPNREGAVIGETTFDDVFGDQPFVVTFTVDMAKLDTLDPATDKIYMAGNFKNYAGEWNEPGTVAALMMEPIVGNENFYTKTLILNAGDYMYKYFLVENDVPSWDNGEWTGDPNREVTVDTTMEVSDIWNSQANINEFAEEALEGLYPNPCQEYINLALNSNVTVEKVEIINALGAVVRTVSGVPFLKELQIQTSDLNKGIYFVTVHTGQGTQTARFIKE